MNKTSSSNLCGRGVFAALMFLCVIRVFAQPTVGLVHRTSEASPGYTLFAPMNSPHTYLIDNDGMLRHRWTSRFRTGHAAYLLPNGHLLRAANDESGFFRRGGGGGGRIEEYDWDGNLVWVFEYSDDQRRQHHDAIKLPNGNVLMIAWHQKTFEEAVEAGRDPLTIDEGAIWSDSLIEVQPTGVYGGTIVWEWHAWDHLIQDFDPGQANHGVVGNHPEKIDVNFSRDGKADWLHLNGIDYHPGLDQILVSTPFLNEIWVIDHSTTTAEAASDGGGRRGRGGDLLYRWGNPAAYRAGTDADQTLFGQHNPQWIDAGLPGAGRILVFNNGRGRPEGSYSSVDEIVPPLTESGEYRRDAGGGYGPKRAAWSYQSDPPEYFYGAFLSGAQRLPNGNTLICNGPTGRFFEVSADDIEVWRYINPVAATGPVQQGADALGNSVFRATRYPVEYPGLVGRELPILGTVELIPDQPFRLVEVSHEGSSVTVRWTSVPEQRYEVQYRSDLDTSEWVGIAEVQAVGTLSIFRDSLEDGISRSLGFYRVLIRQ